MRLLGSHRLLPAGGPLCAATSARLQPRPASGCCVIPPVAPLPRPRWVMSRPMQAPCPARLRSCARSYGHAPASSRAARSSPDPGNGLRARRRRAGWRTCATWPGRTRRRARSTRSAPRARACSPTRRPGAACRPPPTPRAPWTRRPWPPSRTWATRPPGSRPPRRRRPAAPRRARPRPRAAGGGRLRARRPALGAARRQLWRSASRPHTRAARPSWRRSTRGTCGARSGGARQRWAARSARCAWPSWACRSRACAAERAGSRHGDSRVHLRARARPGRALACFIDQQSSGLVCSSAMLSCCVAPCWLSGTAVWRGGMEQGYHADECFAHCSFAQTG